MKTQKEITKEIILHLKKGIDINYIHDSERVTVSMEVSNKLSIEFIVLYKNECNVKIKTSSYSFSRNPIFERTFAPYDIQELYIYGYELDEHHHNLIIEYLKGRCCWVT